MEPAPQYKRLWFPAARRHSLGVACVAELRRSDAEVDDLGEVQLSLGRLLAARQHLPVQLVQPDTGRLTARVGHQHT